jgi:hypothetical protein
MRLASRYMAGVAALMALGAIAPGASLVLDRRPAGCASVPAVTEAFRARVESLEERRHDVASIDQWALGVVREPSQQLRTTFRLVRSYDPKVLYLNPTRFAERSEDLKGAARAIVVETEQGPLPAWLLSVRTDSATRTVAYFFTQESEPLTTPFLAHLRSFWRGWREGVMPMRLYLVAVDAARGREEFTETRARAWLAQAFRRHREVCAP